MKNYSKYIVEHDKLNFFMIKTKNHSNMMGINMILSGASNRSRSHNQLLIRQCIIVGATNTSLYEIESIIHVTTNEKKKLPAWLLSWMTEKRKVKQQLNAVIIILSDRSRAVGKNAYRFLKRISDLKSLYEIMRVFSTTVCLSNECKGKINV